MLYGGTITYSDPPAALLGKRQYGSVATISCPKGYLVSGSTKRTCLDGKWSGDPQNCYPIFKPQGFKDIYDAVDLCFVKKFIDCSKGPSYGPIWSWDVSLVSEMRDLFDYSYYKQDCDSFDDIDGVNNGNISNWNVSRVTSIRGMFKGARRFNGNISKWDVSRVLEMRDTFSNAQKFNADISKWDVSRVKDMERMFEDAEKFNADISKWDVSKVTNMDRMFR